MKNWTMPEVAELTISNTLYGGTPNEDLDNYYFDQAGALHVNFEPEKQHS